MNASNDCLADTNVLVYAHDPRDHTKQRRAIDVLDRLIRNQRAVLSAQCLSEYFVTVTRRLPEPLTLLDATVQVERLLRSCRVLDVTPGIVLEACRATIQHGLSYWDALIWAAARLNQIPYILTEDAPHGRFLEGVRYLNPFVPEFDDRLLT